MSQGSFENRPGYLVKRVQQLLRQTCEDRLSGLSMSQYSVLLVLAANPGVSGAELARLCFVTRQSLRDVLGGLRSAGLVSVAEQTTGRARPVTLTEVGRDVLRAADEIVADVERRLVAGLDQEALVRVLIACADNLTAASN